MFIKRIIAVVGLFCLIGAGCAYDKDLPTNQPPSSSTQLVEQVNSVASPTYTTSTYPLQPSSAVELPRSRSNASIADPRSPTSTQGLTHVLTIESRILPNDECIYFGTGQRELGFNVLDFLVDSFSPSSPLQTLDVGSFSLAEMTDVNKTSQAFAQSLHGVKLETSITCKISSRTQGPIYLVIGTHTVSDALKAQIRLLQSSSTHLAKYAPYPNKTFFVLTPTAAGLTVRRDLAGVPELSALGREDLGPCSGSLIQEYQLQWRCGIGYIKNADGTTSLRNREWQIRLAKDDLRPDVSFVTEQNVGTEEQNGPFFFYGGADYLNDVERLEWSGRSWRVVTSTKSQ